MNFLDNATSTTRTPTTSIRSSIGGTNSKLEGRSSRLKRISHLSGSPLSSLNNSRTSLNKRIKIEYENRFNQYEFSLNLYAIPPFGEISLEEAQKAVEERLKILSVIDEVKTEQAKQAAGYNYIEELNSRFKSLGNNVFINQVFGGKDNLNVQSARRKDHISHFLLRLVACQNETMKRWFIQKEVDLLKYRLETEKSSLDLVKLLIYNNLNFQEVNEKEKSLLIKQNKINYNNTRATTSNVYYKIPFEEALELVRTRRAFLQDGYCFCSPNEMITIISAKFRLELSRSLANLYNHLPQLDESNRLQPIFEKIYHELVVAKKPNRNGANNLGNREQITPDMIDELSITSFPPCMRNTHELLRLNHHLKHYGRLHYGLFLKGIGLSLDDALSFFRDEFIQKITPEKFQKEYSYNIRYNYGKEGKRVNLSAFSCAKIINGNAPGIGDSHGCPFKHYDLTNLTKMLKRHSVDDENINEITNLVKENRPTSACSCYFSCKNKGIKLQADIYHPNQYYIESRKIAKGLHLIQQQMATADDENNQENNDENGGLVVDQEKATTKNSNENEDDNDNRIDDNQFDPELLNDMDFEGSIEI